MRSPLLAVAALLIATPAAAEWPAGPWPQCGPEQPEACPSDLGEKWNLISWVKEGMVLDDPQEYAMGSGLAVDRAWRHTGGSPEVVIAVLDSGIEWDDRAVRRKVHLNKAELPRPAQGVSLREDRPWDLDGDGVFTVDDYRWDLRVRRTDGVDTADDVLNASDLIAVFSDGVDDDANGYIDDIAGWDFHWNDNNPYDDTRFGHGTFEARQSVAEAEDGGAIGTCPDCAYLPVRIGDAFIADVDNIASAVLFATDSGASVVQAALGSLGDNEHLRLAMEQAHSSGLTMVMAGGDETSYHPNPPGVVEYAIYMSANRHDDNDEEDSHTYLNNANCTNYGPRLDLSAPSTDCASGATGVTAGVAGLLYAAALEQQLDPPLEPAEVKQLLLGTADDIDVPLSRGPDADPDRYPSYPGWDSFFGYGRVSAGKAVEALAAGHIPPVAEISSPRWYQVHPERDGEIVVRGAVRGRAGVDSWVLEWAPGGDPRDDAFLPLAQGSGPYEGELGRVDPAELRAGGVLPDPPWGPRGEQETGPERSHKAHRNGVTFRLRALSPDGLWGVARRYISLDADPGLLPAYPLRLDSSVEASPRAGDVDGDGQVDLVIATSGGWVHVLDGRTGQNLDGWPVGTPLLEEVDPAAEAGHADSTSHLALAGRLQAREGLVATPALADLDGDGTDDVVVATMRGSVLAWGAGGRLLPGFPVRVDPALSGPGSPSVTLERGFLAAPVIEDLDGDGDWEIIAAAMDGYVYVWHHDGTLASGWPVPIASVGASGNPFNRIVSSPAVGDIDADGSPDIVVGSNEAASSNYALLYAVHAQGTDHEGGAYLEGFPAFVFAGYTDILPVVGEGLPTSPALADLDGDGLLEIGANAIADTGSIWDAFGQQFSNLHGSEQSFGRLHNTREGALLQMMNSGSFADLDGDGTPEWINGAVGLQFANAFLNNGRRFEFDHLVAAWDAISGEFKPGFPQVIEDLQFFMNPAVGDVGGGPEPEVVTSSGGFLVHAWDVNGVEAPGFPRSTGGWNVASPLLADIDGDGFRDVVVANRTGLVFAWQTEAPAWADLQWPTFSHDARGTGNLETPLPLVPEPELVEQGCGCSQGDNADGAWALLGVLGLWWRRR